MAGKETKLCYEYINCYLSTMQKIDFNQQFLCVYCHDASIGC